MHYSAKRMIDQTTARGSKKVFFYMGAESTPNRDAFGGQIINLLMVGRDSTACLMVWTLFLLIRHPEVMEKPRAEIRRDCSDPTQLTMTSPRKVSYLQSILRETLRLCRRFH